MQLLANRYHPITGEPFRRDESYWEMAPCDALKPYIRCFWGSPLPVAPAAAGQIHQGLVIPDTCMDIIFDINYTQNLCSASFCTLDEQSYRTGGSFGGDLTATFAIRFYAWTASLFADLDFTGQKNRAVDAEQPFRQLVAQLRPLLFDEPTLAGKAAVAEAYFLRALERVRPDPDLLNAVYFLLATHGSSKISDLCGYAALSSRGLERLFQRHMGVSPKSFASLVRYQLLWQEMTANPRLDVLDAVAKYGYTDQAHLLHDFKRRHLMTPAEALRLAWQALPRKEPLR